MESLLWRFVFVVNVIRYANAFDDMPRLDPAIPTVSPHVTPVSSDSCVGQCAMILVDEMNSQLGQGRSVGLLNLNYNEFLIAFSNITFFESFCGIYQQFQYCYSKCDHGYLQEMLVRSSDIIDQFCLVNYKQIKERFPCLSQHLAMNGDSTQAERYLEESCEYVICTLHCDVPAIAHHCNFETANLVVNLTKNSFGAMQKLALDSGAVSKWPSMCNDIKTFSLPTPKSPPQSEGVIAQSPIVKEKSNSSQKIKSSLAAFGAVTLIFFGLLIR